MKINKVIEFVGLSGILGMAILFYILFINAYFFGNYQTTFNINLIQEANIELILFTFSIIIGIPKIWKLTKIHFKEMAEQ